MITKPTDKIGGYQKKVCPCCGQVIGGGQRQPIKPTPDLPDKRPPVDPEWNIDPPQRPGFPGRPGFPKPIPKPGQPKPPFRPGFPPQKPGVTWGDSPPPNSPVRYTAVMPPVGMKYIYNQETGQRSTVPIDGGKGYGQPDQNYKRYPTRPGISRKTYPLPYPKNYR